MYKYDLYKILKEELKNGSSDLVTRPSGQVIRERIERDIVKVGDRVRLQNQTKTGLVTELKGKKATVIIGDFVFKTTLKEIEAI